MIRIGAVGAVLNMLQTSADFCTSRRGFVLHHIGPAAAFATLRALLTGARVQYVLPNHVRDSTTHARKWCVDFGLGARKVRSAEA